MDSVATTPAQITGKYPHLSESSSQIPPAGPPARHSRAPAPRTAPDNPGAPGIACGNLGGGIGRAVARHNQLELAGRIIGGEQILDARADAIRLVVRHDNHADERLDGRAIGPLRVKVSP